MKYTTLAIVNNCQHGKQAVITQEGAAVLLMILRSAHNHNSHNVDRDLHVH